MLAIKNNLMATNAAKHLGRTYDSLSTSVERLASGQRINSAKDDAACLAVRELIRADIAVLQQGSRNAQDGISMLQIMEGAMAVIDENLIRMKELAEQAATGSYSAAQRLIMNSEFCEMADEIDRIAVTTKFNDISMLNATGTVSIHVGTDTTIDIDKVNMTKAALGINTGISGQSAAFDASVASTSSGAYLTVQNEDATVKIRFTNSAGDPEDEISVTFTNEGGTAGVYTLDQVVSEINKQTQALGFANDGTDKNYNMATIVTNDDDTYSLKLVSRGASDGMMITVQNTVAGAESTLQGVFGTDVDVADVAAAVDAGIYEATTLAAGVNIATAEAAVAALDSVESAIHTKDQARASFGYKINRLESTIAILDIQSENLMTAESRISDVDFATEMVALTKTHVLSQAGISVLTQANQIPQMALALLRV